MKQSCIITIDVMSLVGGRDQSSRKVAVAPKSPELGTQEWHHPCYAMITRMHSSRMRTTSSSSHLLGGCLAWRPPWVWAWRPPRCGPVGIPPTPREQAVTSGLCRSNTLPLLSVFTKVQIDILTLWSSGYH